MKRRFASLIAHVALVVGLLALWEVAVSDSRRLMFLFGSPSAILRAAATDIQTAPFWQDVLATASVTLIGLAAGTVLGAALGLAIWVHPRVATFMRPYILAAGALPIFALAPMLIIWFGVGLMPKIVMASFSVLLVMIIGTYSLARDAHADHEEWMTGLSMSRGMRLRLVVIPVVLDGVLVIMARSVGIAIVATFIGEFIASQNGLGRYILKSGGLYDMPRVLFGIVALALLSLLISETISAIARLRHRSPATETAI